MDRHINERLQKFETSFERFRPFFESIGKDITRPFKAIRDGYYEAALTNAGSIIEDVLKDIWRKEKISGKESKKTIEQLFSVIKNQVEFDRLVEDYIRDIQLSRNRAAHGLEVVAEDALETLRKLYVILEWHAAQYPELGRVYRPEPAHRTGAALLRTVQDGALKVAETPRARVDNERKAGDASPAEAGADDVEGTTLEIQISRETDSLKTCMVKKGLEEKETLRHYEEKKFDPSHIETQCREIVRLLNNANLRGALGGENLSQLKKAGFGLFEELLPHEVQKELLATKLTNLILNIDDGLVHIPWELLYDGYNFLCRKFNVGRVVRTRQKIVTMRFKKLSAPVKMLILCDPRGDLKRAYEEGDRVRAELDTHTDVVHADLFNRRVDANMLRGYIRNYDIIHYAGHAEYNADTPSESGWLIEQGKFTSRDILQLSRNLPLPALVFSNACKSGVTQAWTLDEGFEKKIYGLAHAFLVSGVQHYIGTFWEVLDEVSCEFSACFYQNLIRGESIGSALKKAREHLITRYGEENIIWASYVLYGHPEFKYFGSTETKPQSAMEAQTHAPSGSDMGEAMPTRARPVDRRRKNPLVIAGTVLGAVLVTGVLVLLALKGGPVLPTGTAEKQSAVSSGDEQKSREHMQAVLQALSQKYREQKQRAGGVKPGDMPASQEMSLSVLGFTSIGNVEDHKELEEFFMVNLSQAIIGSGRIRMVEREKLNEILDELNLSTSDIADQDTAMVMFGRLVGARLIGSGKIINLRGETFVNLRVFETGTSQIVISLSEVLTEDNGKEVTQKLSQSLLKELERLYPAKT